MRLELIRHGETALQAEKRYQGVTDALLSPQGRARLRPADFSPAQVFVTPLRRTRETANILFPGAEQIVVPGLAEMHFGVFEGKNYLELEHDPAYRTWVDGMCLGRCPGGEAKAEYCDRVCGTFAALLNRAMEAGLESCVIVAHGGTQMAVLERFAAEARDYYAWQLPCGQGYLLDPADWLGHKQLRVLARTNYTEE